jgi:uncharacterized protein (DUF4213/DUF364 family)
MIFEETYELIKRDYPGNIRDLCIADVRIGTYLTVVRLSDNSLGTSATMSDDLPVCAKGRRDFGDFTPLKIKGHNVSAILETKKESSLISSLKTAVLSAISSGIIRKGNYNVAGNCDPVQMLEFKPGDYVAVIGGFQSYIRKISLTGCRLTVLEKNENCLTADQKVYYKPAEEYKNVLPMAGTVIITGQTIVNSTIDDLLSVIDPEARVVITGPSCSIIPDILFARKVSLVGAVEIIRPDLLFDLAGEGGTGYHLFEYSAAKKICIINDNGKQAQ